MKKTYNDMFDKNQHPALIIIASVPFFIPYSSVCVSESSNTVIDYTRYSNLATEYSNTKELQNKEINTVMPSTYYSIMNKNLTVNIQLADNISAGVDNDYINLYNSLKASVNALIYLTETNPTAKWANYVSYFGHKEYMEYGQFTQVAFSNSSNTNLFNITLEIQSYKPNLKEEVGATNTTSSTVDKASKVVKK